MTHILSLCSPLLRALTVSLAACIIPAQATATPAADSPASATSDPAATIARALPKLRNLIRKGIEQRTPSDNIWVRADKQTVFDGSYDWHSCIAAHWAALSMGRLLEDRELSDFVTGRLSVEALRSELARLAENAKDIPQEGRVRIRTSALFQPYVEGWFLLLLAELQRHPGSDAAALKSLQVETEQLLLTALEQKPFPEAAANASTGAPASFLGNYRSQLFGALALQLAKPSTPENVARFAAWKQEKYLPARAALAAFPAPGPRDFFDVGSMATLIGLLDSGDSATPAARPFLELPAQLPKISEIHPVGAAISQTWPHAAAAAKDPNCRKAFESRLAEILLREDLWAEDFAISSHWLPQFLWFGIALQTESLRAAANAPSKTAEAAASAKPKPKMTMRPKPGTPAPSFAMTDRDGKPVTIEQFAGKVVVLDFWATWCGPCKEAFPHLQELATHYADQGVVVIASCTNDERAKFDAWVDENRAQLPNLVFAHDPLERSPDRASAKIYGVMMIPITFVIGRDGKVCKAVGGYRKGEVLVDAALATAGIDVPAEVLEQAKKDEEARKAASKAPKAAVPAKAQADAPTGGK